MGRSVTPTPTPTPTSSGGIAWSARGAFGCSVSSTPPACNRHVLYQPNPSLVFGASGPLLSSLSTGRLSPGGSATFPVGRCSPSSRGGSATYSPGRLSLHRHLIRDSEQVTKSLVQDAPALTVQSQLEPEVEAPRSDIGTSTTHAAAPMERSSARRSPRLGRSSESRSP